MYLLDDRAELAGRNGQVKEQVVPERFVAKSRKQFLEFLVGRGVRQIALAITEILRKGLPDGIIHRFGARELVQGLAQLVAPRRIGFLAAREPDDANC